MGGKCCTERKDEPEKQLRKKSTVPSNKKALSIGFSSQGDDAEKFDKAFETNDLQSLVKLLSSTQEIKSFEERMHPWAEDPKTVGALAASQLAIVASVADKDNPDVKDNIRNAGAIPPLVGFLKSDQSDRVQAAVVALSFLTADSEENSEATYQAGAMPVLLEHMDAPIAGMRAAAATTLRNMAMVSFKHRREFIQLGGLKRLVSQLSCKGDPSLNLADVQLESVLNLQDVLEAEDGQMVPEFAKEAIGHGAIDGLQTLTADGDDEVKTSAAEVLAELQAFK
jgi:hypothetical protein